MKLNKNLTNMQTKIIEMPPIFCDWDIFFVLWTLTNNHNCTFNLFSIHIALRAVPLNIYVPFHANTDTEVLQLKPVCTNIDMKTKTSHSWPKNVFGRCVIKIKKRKPKITDNAFNHLRKARKTKYLSRIFFSNYEIIHVNFI